MFYYPHKHQFGLALGFDQVANEWIPAPDSSPPDAYAEYVVQEVMVPVGVDVVVMPDASSGFVIHMLRGVHPWDLHDLVQALECCSDFQPPGRDQS